MAFELVKLIDKHMTRPRVSLPRNNMFWPSDASVKWVDTNGIQRVSGACLRQVYLRMLPSVSGSSPDAYSEWIFALGKSVEEILVAQLKEMGLWVANNIKFIDPEHHISGEIDIIVNDPETGELVICEVKSSAGYKAQREIYGNSKIAARPKTNHLLQIMIYIDNAQRNKLANKGKLLYYARDTGHRREFNIGLKENSEGKRHPTIDGIIDHRFTLEDVYDRYKELQFYIDNNEVPPRDYDLYWDDETIQQRWKLGEISKSAYEKYMKKPNKFNTPGDWNCAYCGFSDFCYGDINEKK